MISPRINVLICNALRYRNLFRRRVVSDTQVSGIIGEMVERCGGVGLYPGYGKGRAFCPADLVDDESIRQGLEEARLAGSACCNPELDWYFDVLGCTKVDFCGLNFAGALAVRSVKIWTASHDGES